ncbi:hypothetical protein [Leptodesmis sichuanensis]|nr:hypothetical protein [Leptodesmis sichuanensis]
MIEVFLSDFSTGAYEIDKDLIVDCDRLKGQASQRSYLGSTGRL